MGGGGDRLWEHILRKYKDCEEKLILSKSMWVNLASCQVCLVRSWPGPILNLVVMCLIKESLFNKS